ncbi:uncharacterized protein VP01_295g1 [Puccinia sorghi]|uniref:Uncharacterized protein n=1 Tax=Puccinia sorghi TaxID=27349 RepID=A0A0L6V0S9_9BASI|nr:uncharacterized protein VP01_295g1 [Puccinia sorghi]
MLIVTSTAWPGTVGPNSVPYVRAMFSQSSELDQTRSHILKLISDSSMRFPDSTCYSRFYSKLDEEQSNGTLHKSSKQSTTCKHNWKPGNMRGMSRIISGCSRRRLSWLHSFCGWDINSNYSKAPYRQSLILSQEKSISLTLVCNFNKKFMSYLAKFPGSCDNNYLLSSMQISQKPEKFFDQNQFRPFKGKTLTDFWNVNVCVVLHNLLVELKHQWNLIQLLSFLTTLTTQNEIHGILHPITLAHIEESP